MRLIDADKLIEVLRKSHEYHAETSRDRTLLDRDIRLVKEQPMVEERPKGKWVDSVSYFGCECYDEYHANCSLCGYQIDTREERGYFNFCPNCGADMRGVDNGNKN